MRKRYCELCGATIPKEWDNENHYGTCPACRRGTNFIINDKELNGWEKEEKEKQQVANLLGRYGALERNPKSGIVKVNYVPLAKMICKECGLHFITIEDRISDKEDIFYYIDGVYRRGGENKIKERVDYFLDEETSIHYKNEVVDYIKHKKVLDRRNLEPALNLINLKNGIYDLKTKKLLPHGHEYHFVNQIPVKYDAKADCPKIKKFFKQVLYPEYFDVMQELFGFLLYRQYFLHKAFLFYGGGRNRKGTTINLMHKFLGDDNYTSHSLTDFEKNRFSTANLYGKLANFGAETAGSALEDTSIFKNLTGGEPITGEQKFYGAFSFHNYSKLIFNANMMPYSKYDKSIAFFQRWIVMVFPETFEMGGDKTNPNILGEISTEKELSGLFNWAIEGLIRVLETGKFSYSEVEDEDTAGERFEMLAKPEMRYIKENLKISEGDRLPTDEVYGKYEEWADKRRYPILVKSSFSRSMKKYLFDREKKMGCEVCVTKTANRKSERHYVNVAWKEQPNTLMRLDVEPLADKLKGMKEKIIENKKAGYKITSEFLFENFDGTLVQGAIDSGLLIKRGDGQYEWS